MMTQTANFMQSMNNQLVDSRVKKYINLSVEIEGLLEPTMFKNREAVLDDSQNLYFAPIWETIKQSGIGDLEGATIFYYSWQDSSFCFLAKDPI